MKNFKKVLALVLVVATLLSFATVASAADFKDAKAISNTEAVEVLSAIGVLKGYTDGEFKPTNVITRAEAAKIIAMFDNGDTDIDELYAPVNFSDVQKGHWAESFISYCYHTGIIAGVGNNKYAPNDDVTGVQFLKMVLVVLGFDAKEEGLTGTGYAVAARKLALSLGLLNGVGNDFDYTKGLTRENAAQIMLNALTVGTVTYGKVVDYKGDKVAVISDSAAVLYTGETLASAWNLVRVEKNDVFGRPAHSWYFNDYNYPLNLTSKMVCIGNYTDTPVATYTTWVAGCDVYDDLGVKSRDPHFVSYTDGVPGTNEAIEDKATTGTGAQGQLTEIYAIYGANGLVDDYRIVHINTYLAKVTGVNKEKTDSKGHVVSAASEDLEVYRRADNADYADNHSASHLYRASTASISGNPYEKGTFLLVQGVRVLGNDGRYAIDVVNHTTAESKVAKLTGVDNVSNVAKLSVAGEKTPVACKYAYEADRTTADCWKSLTFFFDSYGNVIGTSEYDAPAEYAVLDKLYIEYAKGDSTVYGVMVLTNGEKVDITVADVIYEGIKFTASDYIARIDDGQIVDNDWQVQWAGSNYYKNYYYGKVVDFVKNENGTYNVNIPGRAVALDNVVIKKGAKFIYVGTDAKVPAYEVTDDTVFLYQTTDAPNATYASYTKETVPSINAQTVQIVADASSKVAKFVYVLKPTEVSTSKVVYWAGNAPAGELVAGTDTLLYTYTVTAIGEDGTLATTTVESFNANLFTDNAGVYKMTVAANGKATAAVKASDADYFVTLTASKVPGVYNYGADKTEADLRTVKFVNLADDGLTVYGLNGKSVALFKDAAGNIVAAYYVG